MDDKYPSNDSPDQQATEDNDTIDEALQQMALLYKSRCVQTPIGSNVTIREIKKED